MVRASNGGLARTPELVNTDPYGQGRAPRTGALSRVESTSAASEATS